TMGYILSLKDVTKLKELDRLKSEFVMTASHELRTPLTGIEMSLDLLDEKLGGRLDGKEQEMLVAARTETRRLKNLTNDLLELSKIEAGKISLETAIFPVNDIFEKAVSVLMRQAHEKDVNLTFAVEQNAYAVKADPNKVTWVLTNLISNALRYTKPGGWVKITAETAGPWMRISVADNGAGIPREYQSKIFDKFVQVDKENSPGGSGLGLAICREIVRAHGGTIWVDSTPGEGSTFVFTLPIDVKTYKEGTH
ncbi:MAG TPA: HAMP domain-containing histidine kinase, partial [Spirochaetes bacterium]|nr:HAMP domain-containing histidine kinase [Spirochaetota bacterium]